MAIWSRPKQLTARVSDSLVVHSYGNSEAQAVEELRRYAGPERLAEWERQTGQTLKVEPYSGKKRGVLIEYQREVDAPKEASLEVRRTPPGTALPAPGKVAKDLEAQGVSVHGEGVTVRQTEQGLRIDVAPGARNVTININMAELAPTGKDASLGRRTEFDNALQKAQREANAYDRALGLSALEREPHVDDREVQGGRSARFEEQARAFAAGEGPFPEKLPAYLLRPAMAEAEVGDERVRALQNLEKYHPDMMRRWREIPDADRAALVEGIRERRQGRDVERTGPPVGQLEKPASELGELRREVQADASMRQGVVQSDRREDVAEEQLSEVGGGRTRVEAPDPTIGKGVAMQVAGMAPIPTGGAGPEWRGTITEALQEVRARHGDVAFASGDWQRQSRVRVYTARELTDTVERVRDLIEPEKNEVKAYTVKPDGTIHNVVTNRDEFVALSGQAFQVRPELEVRLEREKAEQGTVTRGVERKATPDISVGS